MKFAIGVLVVSVAVNVVLIVHGLVQEFHLHRLKTGSSSKAVDMNVKEESIVSTKNEVTRLKIVMETERTKSKELAKRHEEIENAKKESEAKLQSCKSEKEAAANKKTETETALNELKEKKSANEMKEEIEKLKKSIKDRDRMICALADKTKEEAKTLCAE